MPQHVPPEICDLIVDHLHDDPDTLRACSLVSKTWIHRSREHLFNEIEFQDKSQPLLWKTYFPKPSNSPAHHAKFLSFGSKTIKAYVGFIESFTNLTYLQVWVDGPAGREPGLNVSCNLLPTLTTLCVRFNVIKSSQLFALVGSFPSIKDLVVSGLRITDNEDNFLPSTLPELTGILVLDCENNDITGLLLRLPTSALCFRKIVWGIDYLRDEDGVQRMIDLIERCSDTLGYIDFNYHCRYGRPPMTPIDLSKATKLKGVALRLEQAYIKWFTKSLETIPPRKEGLEQILIRFAVDGSNFWAMWERNKQIEDLDNILVRLSEPDGVRTRAVCYAYQGMCLVEDLFPEVMETGKMKSVYFTLPTWVRPSMVLEDRCLRLRRYDEFWEWGRHPVDGDIF